MKILPTYHPLPEYSCFRHLSEEMHFQCRGMIRIAMKVASYFFRIISYCLGKSGEQPMKIPSIVEFYAGQRNDRGVTLEEIWSWDEKRLESQHDYIQWLFPLLTRGVNRTASLTNFETIHAFKQDKQLQEKMLKSFKVMLKFYGFTLDSSSAIRIGPDFSKKAENWLKPKNHNYRRITRILKSLSLHGLGSYSKAFFSALQQVYNEHPDQIGEATFQIWKEFNF